MAGALFGTAVPGAPPTLAFGGNHDSILPFQLEVASCAAIRTAGAPCDMVAYAAQRPPPTQDPCVLDAVPCTYVLGHDEDHGIPFSERRDIVERTSVFLTERVLRPLGMMLRPPVARPGGPYSVVEGSAIRLDGTRSSAADGGRLTYSWSGLDGLDRPSSATPQLRGVDDGARKVTLTVMDAARFANSATTMVTVRNAPPVVRRLIVGKAQDPALRGIVAAFTDPGRADTHTAVVDWGDGNRAAGVVFEGDGRGVAGGQHRYARPGRYTVTVTVTDDDGGRVRVRTLVDVACPVGSRAGPCLH